MRKYFLVALVTAAILVGCGGKDVKEPATTEAATLPPIINDDGFDMVLVEGGTFMMGCTKEQGDECRNDPTETERSVDVKNFYIGKTEVTQGLWKSVMNGNPSEFKGDDNLSVERVNFNDVKKFIRKLNAKTGRKYRLPTDEEWEYAARGGKSSNGYKYSGSNNIDDVAWYGKNSYRKTHPVGTKKPNELGLYDMSGNVWEWTGTAIGPYRAYRGGSWYSDSGYCRISYPWGSYPKTRYNILGFRLALDP